MTSRIEKIDTGISVGFVVSAVIHLAVFLLLLWSGRIFPQKQTIQEAYYVDVVTLPVAKPQSGIPAQAESEEPAPLPAPKKAQPLPLPPINVPKTIAKPIQPVKAESLPKNAESEAFAERMARLERNSELRREEAILEKLRSKIKTGASKIGAPGAGGAESGSRYSDYIKSRLEDALKLTTSYTTKNPEVTVRITISADGKLLRMKVERSSGDATFELAVRRAIDLASEKFTPPPTRTIFENGFVFKPKDISNGASR
jgi:colicin import membrane protein